MKKFTFKGVFEGFRSSGQAQTLKPEQELQELLKNEHFSAKKTFRHGFPYEPTALAFDPVQRLLAIGDKFGSVRILGRPGVDTYLRHEGDSACPVLHITFLVNEGAIITVTDDGTLHIWDLRQKCPQIIQSLKFQREKICCVHLPVASKWLYVGTEKGNVHVVHIETFSLSGYIINWNKAIEVTRTTHPGAVIGLTDNPMDANKLLIAFETGLIVLWDLKNKAAEIRWQSTEPVKSVAWHCEAKYFVSSHSDGSLCTWSAKHIQKPQNHFYPHGKKNKDGKIQPCTSINKVDLRTTKIGETFTIFSGGMPYENKTSCITIVSGRSTTVLEMEYPVVDFITMCESPWTNEMQEPYAVVVLLESDFVLIDLLTPGFPCFESPYPMDLHESPVTCCSYISNCPSDLIPALYSVGRCKSNKKSGFSDREWPITGGDWMPISSGYFELIITGHQDGSIKFWDSSAGSLQVLYKVKTAKLFEGLKTTNSNNSLDKMLAVQTIVLCTDTRMLCIGGASGHVILFDFEKTEKNSEITVLEIPNLDAPSSDAPSPENEPNLSQQNSPVLPTNENSTKKRCKLKVKSGKQRKPPGFQVAFVCLTSWTPESSPNQITSMCLNSYQGLMAYGNDGGLVIIDIVQQVCLLNIKSSDLYGKTLQYSRAPRSPKSVEIHKEDKSCSPNAEQMNGVCGVIAPGSSSNTVVEGQDKVDNPFSRSKSSSMSSLKDVSSEAVTCLTFAESYVKRNESDEYLTLLWIGTSVGTVTNISINVPKSEVRKIAPVLISILGCPIFSLKGSIMLITLLNSSGELRPHYHLLKESGDKKLEPQDVSDQDALTSGTSNDYTSMHLTEISATACNEEMVVNKQYLVVCSEQQARVFTLPNCFCMYDLKISEGFVIKANVIEIKESACLVGYISNGNIMACSLPSLKILLDVHFLPLTDLSFQIKNQQEIVDPILSIWGQQYIVHEDVNSISRTFCFSEKGHGVYLASPTELQKLSICADFGHTITDMMGELFVPHEMPEQPKESFLKGLFGGGIKNIDREELFGEQSGKANRSVAKHIPGATLQQLGARTTTATSEISRAHQLAMERGEKLNLLEERAERMANQAQDFSSSAHQLMLKYRDKKWYQL